MKLVALSPVLYAIYALFLIRKRMKKNQEEATIRGKYYKRKETYNTDSDNSSLSSKGLSSRSSVEHSQQPLGISPKSNVEADNSFSSKEVCDDSRASSPTYHAPISKFMRNDLLESAESESDSISKSEGIVSIISSSLVSSVEGQVSFGAASGTTPSSTTNSSCNLSFAIDDMR